MPKFLEEQIDAVEDGLNKVTQSNYHSVLDTFSNVTGHLLMPGYYNSLKTAQEIVGDVTNKATNLIAEPISNATNVDQRAINTALQAAAGIALGNGNGVKKTVPTRQSLNQGIPGKVEKIKSTSSNKVVDARSGLLINKTEVGAIGDVSPEFRSISENDALIIRPQTQRQLVRANFTSGNMRSSDRVLSTAPPEINPSPIAYRKKDFIQPGKHQHHEVYNMPFAEIVRKMYAVGDVDDVTNLHALMMSRKHPTGDRLNALLMADPEPHLATHGLAKKRGLELNRKQMRMKLAPLKTRQEVFEFVDNWITSNVEPSKELFIKAQKDFENLSTQAQSQLLQYLNAIRERGA